ncbi:FAD-binding protein [Propionibacterium sp.]|uniref:FAD-dependent oxidoreductase n=1 Tax=Propionibacterium sp. TaxID=1977903 RepID=UPI0039EBD5A1
MSLVADPRADESTSGKATQLSMLLKGIDGDCFTPAHPEWDRARQAWNLAVEQNPVAVVEPETAEDVSAVLRAAGMLGLQVAPQSTGHGAASLGDLAGTLVLRTLRMNQVHIDPDRMIARVGAGVLWRDVVEPAAAMGLAAPAGTSSDVGVVGYTLGGGIGWLARSHGLAANSVTAIEVVTADGTARRLEVPAEGLPGEADQNPGDEGSDDTDADLLWALRGGGGDFGVVTALEFRLYPMTDLYAGSLMWPSERAGEVLHAWREWVQDLPPSVTTAVRLMRFPPMPELPSHLSGKSLVVVEAAAQESGRTGTELLAPLRALGPEIDTFAIIAVNALQGLHMDPPEPVPAVGDGALIRTVSPELIDALVTAAGPRGEQAAALLSVELRLLGGELSTSRGEGGAIAGFDAEAALYAVGMTPVLSLEAAVHAGIRTVLSAVGPWRCDTDYLNFAEEAREPQALFGGALERLRRIHERVDPHGIIRSNHPVNREIGSAEGHQP